MSQHKFHVELVEPPLTLTHQNSNPPNLNPLTPEVFVEFVHKVNKVYYSRPKDSHGDLIHRPDYDHVEIKKVAETGFDLWMVDASFPYCLIWPKLNLFGVDPSMYSHVVDQVILECKNALYFHYWNNYNGGSKVLHVRVSIEEEKVNMLDPETNHEQEEDSVDNDDDDDNDNDNDFPNINDYYGFVDEEEERVRVPTSEAWIEELLRRVRVRDEEKEEDHVDDDDDDDDYYDDHDCGFVVDEQEVRVMVPTSESSIEELLKRVRVGDDDEKVRVCAICLEELCSTY